MKRKYLITSVILGLLLIITGVGILWSEIVWGHIPITSHQHPIGNCYGYAQGRAFGKPSGDSECDPVHTSMSNIDVNYFPVVQNDPTFSGIQPGDIIVFDQSHAAYVVSVPDPFNIDGITVDQVPNEGLPEQKGFSVGVVRQTYGDPILYHRRSGGSTATITFFNSFGGGIMYAATEQDNNWKIKDAGVGYPYFVGTSLEIMAVDTQHNTSGIRQRFQYWQDGLQHPNPRTIQINGDATYTAKFENEFAVTFQNALPGGSGGQMKVRSVTVPAPHNTQVRQETEQSVAAEALYQIINRIEYTFSSWSMGSTTASTTFTPSTNNVTYTANFTSKPLPPENVWAGGTAGNYVQVTWSEHPSSSVTQYQI